MRDYSEAFVAFDTSKSRNAVAIAEGGRRGEVRFIGEIENSAAATAKLVRKLAGSHGRLTFCYEAGPTGYGLYRQIVSLGHDCIVVAPSLIPQKPGDRVKTNRRDAVGLAKLLRAGELTPVWVPDPRHEAIEQPETWVTVLTGDMGNTFPVLFRSVAVVPVDPVGNAQRCPQVHRRHVVWVCAGGPRNGR